MGWQTGKIFGLLGLFGLLGDHWMGSTWLGSTLDGVYLVYLVYLGIIGWVGKQEKYH